MVAVLGIALVALALGLPRSGLAGLWSADPHSGAAPAAVPPPPSGGWAAGPSTAATPRPRPVAGRPVRLRIPALHVDSRVVPVSAAGGVLTPPADPRVLGWWRAGARPGGTGSVLLTGHTVHTGGGAFDDLGTLRPGDAVVVQTPRGRLGYAVRAVRVYRKAALARQARRLFAQHVPGRLVLVTCQGWNGSGYASNAVVVAGPVGGTPGS